MNRLPLVCFSILCVCLLLAGLCGAQDKALWKVGGTTLYSTALESLAESYRKTGNNCRPVIVGTSTGKGISQLMNGEVALVAASRALTSEEKEQAARKNLQIEEKKVGETTLAIITSAKNPLNELTLEQLRKIFIGEIANWKEVGGPDELIRVTIRAVPESGAGVFFQETILKGTPYTATAQVMQSYKTTVNVAGKSLAIGYLPTASAYYQTMSEAGVKELRIKTTESAPALNAPVGVVRETTFPLNIPLVFIWNKQSDNPCVKGFVDFIENKLGEASSEYRPDAVGAKTMIATRAVFNGL